MLIACEFHGVAARQGMPLGDGWRILGDINTPMDLHLVREGDGGALYCYTSKCLKVQLHQIGADIISLQGYISIQRPGHAVRHACFFRGVCKDWPAIADMAQTDVQNAPSGGAAMAGGGGGFGRLRGHPVNTDVTTEAERKAICWQCPSMAFNGQGCDLMKCCRKREADPRKWRRALQSGACPRGHWDGTNAVAALKYPMTPGTIMIDGCRIPTL